VMEQRSEHGRRQGLLRTSIGICHGCCAASSFPAACPEGVSEQKNAKIRPPLGITTKSDFVFTQVRRETGKE